MVMEMVSSYWLAVLIGLLIGSSITASGKIGRAHV